ncbi:MAG TPA: polysaccharide deacetylase family protein [Chitinophagaceae bacterium]|nr:polysaccharide deacetylase family protein [Chitinophagaceae bacterium]
MGNQVAKGNAVRPSYQEIRWYPVKTPWILKKLYPAYTWEIGTKEKIIYLTFDDGPHPEATVFVLEELRKYNARATFFCIGKNVQAQPDLFRRILEEGHSVGNHTQHHLNGWKTNDQLYLEDIALAARSIDSRLFRPPYGKITRFQAKNLSRVMKTNDTKIIMWSVLSGDFDSNMTRERCLQNVILNAGPGSIVVFHDSEKAYPLLQYTLPKVLHFFSEKGYRFERL